MSTHGRSQSQRRAASSRNAGELGDDTSSAPGQPWQSESVDLRARSVRELIAELAQLERALWPMSASPSDVDRGAASLRTREVRIVAELRRRHAELRSWSTV